VEAVHKTVEEEEETFISKADDFLWKLFYERRSAPE
jgi:hypothetical protein